MSLLEELWYGNLQPTEKYLEGNRKYFHRLEEVVAQEDAFVQSLPQVQRDCAIEVLDMQVGLNAMGELAAFELGFSMGVQLMTEVSGVQPPEGRLLARR